MYSKARFLPSVFRKRRPVHLTFFVTRRCNARCPFCFYQDNAKEHRDELSLDEVRRLAPSVGPLLWLAFSGGEVFLREDLPDLCRVFYEQTRPSIILLPTNALMPGRIREMTEEVLRSCPRSVVTVKLSLDALGEKHDALRGVPGSFEKLLRTREALADLLDAYSNFELGVNTVFTRANQDDMDDIIRFAGELPGIKTHTISLVRGDVAEGTYKDVDLAKYLRAARRLERKLKEGSAATYRFRGARVKAAQDVIQRRLIHRTAVEQKAQLPCYAGRLNVVLTETGDVYPCESFRQSHRMGNVREADYHMGRLLRTARAREVVKRIRAGCFCTHECYMMTNILFNPRLYPGLLRETAAVRPSRRPA
ncbi:MAG: radical SAM/SPASM domain-containing protein [Nitrospirota bacterium]